MNYAHRDLDARVLKNRFYILVRYDAVMIVIIQALYPERRNLICFESSISHVRVAVRQLVRVQIRHPAHKNFPSAQVFCVLHDDTNGARTVVNMRQTVVGFVIVGFQYVYLIPRGRRRRSRYLYTQARRLLHHRKQWPSGRVSDPTF